MREILFRGKRNNSMKAGEWAEGFFMEWLNPCKNRKEARIQTISEGGCIDLIHEVDPSTVGQYTGLKDKNGKRIFEGDIIRYADKLDYACYLECLERPEDYEGCDYSDIFTIDKVVYGNEWDYPAFDLDKHGFDCNGLSELAASMDYHYEVIGNIHDNPELLEVR